MEIIDLLNIKKIVRKFRKGNAEMITFDQLKEFPLNRKVEIIPKQSGAISTTKIHENENSISFRVEMKQNFKWAPHVHDCYEVLVVYKGECKDLVSGKIASARHQLIIPTGRLHEVICLSEEAIFYVEFIKDNKNV